MSDSRRKETSLAPILLGASAIGVALVFAAVYFLSGYINRHMSRDVPHLGPQREGTPIHDVFPGGMYPGAQAITTSQAKIAVELPASGSFQAVSAEFETQDKMDDVIAYYRKMFGKQAEERREGPDSDSKAGGVRWTLQDPIRIISIKEVGGRPHIRLVWIANDQPEKDQP